MSHLKEELQKVPWAVAWSSGREMKASHLEGGLEKEDEGSLCTVERVCNSSENQENRGKRLVQGNRWR